MCRCFLMYFAVLLLDSKSESQHSENDFLDSSDIENKGQHQVCQILASMWGNSVFIVIEKTMELDLESLFAFSACLLICSVRVREGESLYAYVHVLT